MRTFTVDLPFPVPLAACFKNVGRSRAATPRYKAYVKEAGQMIMAQGSPKAAGPVVVEVFLAKPDNRKRDGDNLLKCLLDTLVKSRVIADDNCDVVIAGSWAWADHGVPCRVKITEIEVKPIANLRLAGVII